MSKHTRNKNGWGLVKAATPVLLLLLLGLAVRRELFRGVPPLLEPDSTSYIQAAGNLMDSGQLANRARPPGYPILLAFIFLFAGARDFQAVVSIQELLGLITLVTYYFLFHRVFRKSMPAFLLAAAIGLNYKILAFEQFILTEAFCVFLMAIFCLLLLCLLERKEGKQNFLFAGMLTTQAGLILTKPFFLLLPVPVGILLTLRWRHSNMNRKELMRRVAGYASFSLLPVLFWHGVNLAAFGRFQFTMVKDINLLGKIVQTRQYRFAAPEHGAITDFLVQHESEHNPYRLLAMMKAAGIIKDERRAIGEYTRRCILNAPVQYAWANIRLVPMVLESQYEPTRNSPSKSFKRPFSRAIDRVNRISSHPLNLRILAVIIGSLLFFLAGPWRQTTPPVFWWQSALFAALIFYSLFIATFGGYVAYGRLMIVVEPLRQFFLLALAPCLLYRYATWRFRAPKKTDCT